MTTQPSRYSSSQGTKLWGIGLDRYENYSRRFFAATFTPLADRSMLTLSLLLALTRRPKFGQKLTPRRTVRLNEIRAKAVIFITLGSHLFPRVSLVILMFAPKSLSRVRLVKVRQGQFFFVEKSWHEC